MRAEYQIAVQHLKEWQNGENHFIACLYNLIAKADRSNRESLKLAFPFEVQAFEDWRNSKDERRFFSDAFCR